jgi:hypothetical protein
MKSTAVRHQRAQTFYKIVHFRLGNKCIETLYSIRDQNNRTLLIIIKIVHFRLGNNWFLYLKVLSLSVLSVNGKNQGVKTYFKNFLKGQFTR